MIREYLEERYPDPSLLPADLSARAQARRWVWDHDRRFADDDYALRRGEPREPLEARFGEFDRVLQEGAYLAGDSYSLADIAYLPWIRRARDLLHVELDRWRSLDWLARLEQRPVIATELHVVATL